MFDGGPSLGVHCVSVHCDKEWSVSDSTDVRYWIGFQRIPGIGPARLASLLELFDSVESAWCASISDLTAAGVNPTMADNIVRARERIDLDGEMTRLTRSGITAIPLDDHRYPRLLLQIPHPPTLLYVLGEIEPTDELAVGIVGTRRMTTYGADMARRITEDLAGAGVTIVSGLALGVDTIAHQTALEHGGRTIAVFGCGLDTVYPPKNRRLAQAIIEHGALVSEFPIGTKPDARNFPVRNRIISGLSRGILVVEAPVKSGALITATYAGEQGRDVWAVPGSALSKSSSGNHSLIRDGATLVTSGQDILEDLQIESVTAAVQTRMLLPETAEEEKLYRIIGADPRHIDELARDSGLTIQEANGTLLAMELKGLIRQSGTQHYVRV